MYTSDRRAASERRSAHVCGMAYAAGAPEADLRRRSDPNRDRTNALTADVLIAAVAEAEGATVVTRNVEDFELLDVPVETY